MDHGHRSRGFSGPPGAHGRGGGRGRVMIPKADRGVYDGKSKRPMIVRKAVDFQSDSITYLSVRSSIFSLLECCPSIAAEGLKPLFFQISLLRSLFRPFLTYLNFSAILAL